MSYQEKVTIHNMSQILLTLNFWESKQLEYWLTDNYPDVKIRVLYDTWSPPESEEWYALEGPIDTEFECLLRLKYGDKIRSGIRFGNV
jgi:hypothetical protein